MTPKSRYWLAPRVSGVLASALIVTAAVYLPVAELLTRVDSDLGPSLNLFVSVLAVCVAGLVLLLQKAWPVLVACVIVTVWFATTGIAEGNDPRHLQYLVPPLALGMTAFVIMGTRNSSQVEKWMLVGSLLVLPAWLVFGFIFDSPVTRASAPVVPVATLVLLTFSQGRGHLLRLVCFASTLLMICYLAWTTSRMASALTLMVVLIWTWTLSPWAPRLRALVSGMLLLLVAFLWLGGSWQRERLFGRDASISIGPLSVNGEGRMEAATIALASVPESSISQLFLGLGGGSSGQQLVDSGFVLDKPHNEFVRVLVDGGIVLVFVLALLATMPLIVGLINYRCTRHKSLLVVPAAVSLIVLGFSLSDNALSYIWLMLPAGVLVSWSRSARVLEKVNLIIPR